MSYVPNNIRFRTVSSKSLERYYNAKSFILNELIDERNQFSETAREIMLLLFNHYSKWVTTIESLMLNRDILTEGDIQIILKRYGEVVEVNKTVFSVHKEIFLGSFLEVWTPHHKIICNHFKDSIKQVSGMSNILAYPVIIESLVSALQTTLFELYEVDCFLGSNLVQAPVTSNRSNVDNLVAYIDGNTLDIYKSTGVNPLRERILKYSRLAFAIPLNVKIKNYTQKSVALKESKLIGNDTLVLLVDELRDIPNVNILDILQS